MMSSRGPRMLVSVQKTNNAAVNIGAKRTVGVHRRCSIGDWLHCDRTTSSAHASRSPLANVWTSKKILTECLVHVHVALQLVVTMSLEGVFFFDTD